MLRAQHPSRQCNDAVLPLSEHFHRLSRLSSMLSGILTSILSYSYTMSYSSSVLICPKNDLYVLSVVSLCSMIDPKIVGSQQDLVTYLCIVMA